MRKFKFNKAFQPMTSDAGDELYANGIFVFNITKMLQFIDANKEQFPLEEVEVKTLRTLPPRNLNETTIQKANLSAPIILAEISPRPGGFNVIDGRHRLEKAYSLGLKKISAYRLLAEQHIMFLDSIDAYKAYIDYWNEKIKQINKENNVFGKIPLPQQS